MPRPSQPALREGTAANVPEQGASKPSSAMKDNERDSRLGNLESFLDAPLQHVMQMEMGANPAQSFLELIFVVEGFERQVKVCQQPLGAQLQICKHWSNSERPPSLRKIHPHSYAQELGLVEGWELKAIDGNDVRKMTCTETETALKSAFMSLPVRRDDSVEGELLKL